ncbi:MAG TPA: ornithine carbamoyltransferase [Candidatus Nanopelagicaceae bacterium]|nr:ornithine carbamoyltransferase [Candidatus Nanopelagicaceae bacterium]
MAHESTVPGNRPEHTSAGMKDLLRTYDLSLSAVNSLLDTAARFAVEPLAESGFIANQSVVIHMTKPSTRTRLASETAVAHLGGTPIFVRNDELQLGRGESIADTARIISGYAKALIIRTFKQSDVDELAANATVPVINALTDLDHPTQALADWLTIREIFGSDLNGRKFTYVGDGNNMAHAWLEMGATLGVHVTVATPGGDWAPDEQVIEHARQRAKVSGATIEITTDPREAVRNASVVYTDVWMSMGDSEDDRSKKMRALTPFAVTESLMSLSAPDGVFMHCLPAHRGEEVEASVMEGERSVVWREAFHRRTTIQALLFHLIKGDLAR